LPVLPEVSRRRAGVAVLLAALAGTAVLAGCTSSPDAGGDRTPVTAAPLGRETVTVSDRTIVSAIKLDGTVEPLPGSTVAAPAGGTLRLRSLRDLAGTQIAAGQELATVEMPCEQPDTTAIGATASDETTAGTAAPVAPCRGRVVAVTAPAAGRLALAGAIERAVGRGDATAEVGDGDEIAGISPGGWQLRLPLGDDDQPARFAKPPPAAYAILTGTFAAVFQAKFDRLDYSDDGSVSVIATPLDPPDLIRGAKVTVSFVTDRRDNVPTLPLSAVRAKGNTGLVLVLTDPKTGRTEEKSVIVGPNDGSWIEVQGLTANDRVVRYPLDGELSDP
jgi:hypothetical protein